MNSQNVSVGRRVLNAIQKLQGNKGISLLELKKFLRNEKKMDVDQFNEEIKLALKNYMDREILSREGGLYKVNESKRRRSRSKGGKSGSRRRSKSRKRSGSKRKRSGSKRKSSGGKKRSGSRRRRRRKASPAEE